MDSSKLKYLLSSYQKKTATEGEIKELLRLLHRASDEELTAYLHKEWEALEVRDPFFEPSRSSEMLERILEARNEEDIVRTIRKKRKYITIQRFAAAAAILIVVCFGIYLTINPAPADKQSHVSQKILNDALPGGNRATLTLSNGKTIVLDNAENGILAEQGSIRVRKTKNGQLVYDASAQSLITPYSQLTYNTLTTPRGGQYQIVLPDGSKVWLNAASSLKFPSVFKGKERVVELTGEAYFEVAKNGGMPFRVKSSGTEIEVLGTHFNIMAYENESALKATLLEGSVKIKNDAAANILKPGEQAIVAGNGIMKVTDNIDVNEVVAWKDGLFQFNGTDLPTIMRQAARWYDLDISYEGQIPQRHFTGRISRNVKASELLKILEYTGVNFKIQGKKIIVMN